MRAGDAEQEAGEVAGGTARVQVSTRQTHGEVHEEALILSVDDEATNHLVVAEILRSQNYAMHTVSLAAQHCLCQHSMCSFSLCDDACRATGEPVSVLCSSLHDRHVWHGCILAAAGDGCSSCAGLDS